MKNDKKPKFKVMKSTATLSKSASYETIYRCTTCGSYTENDEFCEVCGDFALQVVEQKTVKPPQPTVKELAAYKLLVFAAIMSMTAIFLILFN